MSEDVVYENPSPVLTRQVRHGRGEREMEIEERGENEDRGERIERIVDIYVSADSDESKKNHSRVAGLFLVLLCFLLLAVIIGLIINNKEKNNNLVKERDELQSSFDQLEMRYNNLTKETEDLTRIICESWGWKPFARGCYNISFGEKNWQQSRQYCKDREGDLVVINSKEKQDFVNRLNKRVWLGLTDTEEEGTFVWVDNTSLTTPTYWRTDPPDNSGEKNCVEFIHQISEPYRVRGWNVRRCDGYNDHCICERVIN